MEPRETRPARLTPKSWASPEIEARSVPTDCVFRPLMVSDEDHSELRRVMTDWKQSNRRFGKHFPQTVYHVGMEKMIGALALTQRLLLMVSPSLPADENIVGWVCFRPRKPEDGALVVHYLYVRKCYRGNRVGEQLLAQAGWRGPEDVIVGTHVWHAPREVRHRYKVYFNDFFIKIGSV